MYVLVVNRTKESETGSNFLLRAISLNNGTNNSNINVLSTDVVCRRDHSDVDIYTNGLEPTFFSSLKVALTVSPVNLVLGDNDLSRVDVLGSRNRVLEDANSSDNLAFLDHANLTTFSRLAGTEVAGVADDMLSLDGL